jgi:catechol 2,3-dioxygenase-like lactoylglutathione lyase family enzyme
MSLIPLIKCTDMKESVSFYTKILDFEHIGTWPDEEASPSFTILKRNDYELHLSSHAGDGVFGSVFSVIIDEIDELFKKFRERGLNLPRTTQSPVHLGPVNQDWGTKEFYVDDPDGNTIRFVKRYFIEF